MTGVQTCALPIYGDGLSDAEEQAIGTDPNNRDSDFDGVGDGNEFFSGYDPLDIDDTFGFSSIVVDQIAVKVLLTLPNAKTGKTYSLRKLNPATGQSEPVAGQQNRPGADADLVFEDGFRSEEHTSELQSRTNLVCRLLL